MVKLLQILVDQSWYQVIQAFWDHVSDGQATLISAMALFITAVLGFIGIRYQLNKQLRDKVIHEGWREIQGYIFLMSSNLIPYSVIMLSLPSKIDMAIDHPNFLPINWKELRKEIDNNWEDLVKSYIEMLKSFEAYEIFYLEILKLKDNFINEWRKVEDLHLKLSTNHLIFITSTDELSSNSEKLKEIKIIANDIYEKTAEFSAFLDDFRKELQNITFNSVIGKKVTLRRPKSGYKILTRSGFKFQR